MQLVERLLGLAAWVEHIQSSSTCVGRTAECTPAVSASSHLPLCRPMRATGLLFSLVGFQAVLYFGGWLNNSCLSVVQQMNVQWYVGHKDVDSVLYGASGREETAFEKIPWKHNLITLLPLSWRNSWIQNLYGFEVFPLFLLRLCASEKSTHCELLTL